MVADIIDAIICDYIIIDKHKLCIHRMLNKNMDIPLHAIANLNFNDNDKKDMIIELKSSEKIRVDMRGLAEADKASIISILNSEIVPDSDNECG